MHENTKSVVGRARSFVQYVRSQQEVMFYYTPTPTRCVVSVVAGCGWLQIRQLQEDKSDLERQVTELSAKCEQIKPREAERYAGFLYGGGGRYARRRGWGVTGKCGGGGRCSGGDDERFLK